MGEEVQNTIPENEMQAKVDYLAYGGESNNYFDNRAIAAIERGKKELQAQVLGDG